MARVCQMPFVELHLVFCPDGAATKGGQGVQPARKSRCQVTATHCIIHGQMLLARRRTAAG